jgi:hypothetical protein
MENEHKSSWKGCIIFGIINILLVLLCTKLNVMIISTGMMLLIAAGIYVSVQSAKEDFGAGLSAQALGCVVGLLVNAGAAVLYVVNILLGLINTVMRLFGR